MISLAYKISHCFSANHNPELRCVICTGVTLFELVFDSNWTEWSTIQGVIVRVISKSDEGEAQGQFEITSTITPWIVRHEVQLLINRIYNKFRN